jgi:hypothetical protein
MSQHPQLQAHLPRDELARRCRAARHSHEPFWWPTLWLLSQGHTARELAKVTDSSSHWIGQMAKRYNAERLTAMHDRQQTRSQGTAPLLSAGRQEELLQDSSGRAPDEDR